MVALAILFLYVLSSGPVWWLHKHGVLSKSTFATIYRPIAFLDNSPHDIVYRYINWWSPVTEF